MSKAPLSNVNMLTLAAKDGTWGFTVDYQRATRG